MEKQIRQVVEFQKKFKSIYNTTPTLLRQEQANLRYLLLKEENEEYLEAVQNEDVVEILDALIDQLFITIGTAVSHGLQDKLEEGFNIVFNSNMSKLDENGEPIFNGENGVLDKTKPLGKLLKSKNYKEPNLKVLWEEK